MPVFPISSSLAQRLISLYKERLDAQFDLTPKKMGAGFIAEFLKTQLVFRYTKQDYVTVEYVLYCKRWITVGYNPMTYTAGDKTSVYVLLSTTLQTLPFCCGAAVMSGGESFGYIPKAKDGHPWTEFTDLIIHTAKALKYSMLLGTDTKKTSRNIATRLGFKVSEEFRNTRTDNNIQIFTRNLSDVKDVCEDGKRFREQPGLANARSYILA